MWLWKPLLPKTLKARVMLHWNCMEKFPSLFLNLLSYYCNNQSDFFPIWRASSLLIFVPSGQEEPLDWPPTRTCSQPMGWERFPWFVRVREVSMICSTNCQFILIAASMWSKFLKLFHLPNLVWFISCVSVASRSTVPNGPGIGYEDFSLVIYC